MTRQRMISYDIISQTDHHHGALTITDVSREVSFSLGTDTAGSGRVPAALNNIVGLKVGSSKQTTEKI